MGNWLSFNTACLQHPKDDIWISSIIGADAQEQAILGVWRTFTVLWKETISIHRHLLLKTHFRFVTFKNQSGHMVVFHAFIHFPPHLHGDTPALHGRKTVAHVAVAAIRRALRCVRLRQISPHGCWFLWLFTWREDDTEETSRLVSDTDTNPVRLSHFNYVNQLGLWRLLAS